MRRRLFVPLLVFSALHAAPGAEAQLSFVPAGARSMALGGAAVALQDGPTSALDNPASVPDGTLRGALTAGAEGVESGDFLEPLRQAAGTDLSVLASGRDPQAAARVEAALRNLAIPGNGLVGTGRAGLALTSKGWALTVSDTVWAGAFARPDLVHVRPGSDPATSWANNASAAAWRSLSLLDVGVANSRSFLSGAVSIGGAIHLLRGTTSAKEESAFTIDATDLAPLLRRATSGAERTRTTFSVDAGLLVSVGVVRVGVVMKAINRPSFPFDDASAPSADRAESVTYGRQTRVGAAVKIPVVGILLTADYDLEAGDTLLPNLRNRQLGGGLEWKIAVVSVRAGLSVNLESPDRRKVFSGGAGVTLGPVRVDGAGVYNPDGSAVGAILTARAGI